MNVKEMNIENICHDIFCKASQKALSNILKTKVVLEVDCCITVSSKIKFDDNELSIYEPSYSSEDEFFMDLLRNSLKERHGCDFTDCELLEGLKVFNCFKYKERIKFLQSNNIIGTPQTFEKDLKNYILKKYNLI